MTSNSALISLYKNASPSPKTNPVLYSLNTPLLLHKTDTYKSFPQAKHLNKKYSYKTFDNNICLSDKKKH